LPAGGFCIFRESITNSSANISGAWLSAMLGDLRDSFRWPVLLREFPALPTGIEFHSKLIFDVSKIDASPVISESNGRRTVVGASHVLISDTFF